MIVKVIMDALKAVLLFFIGLFPAFPDLTGLLDVVQPFFEALGMVDAFVSVKLLATCIGALLLISQAELVWSVIVWVYKKLPGVS